MTTKYQSEGRKPKSATAISVIVWQGMRGDGLMEWTRTTYHKRLDLAEAAVARSLAWQAKQVAFYTAKHPALLETRDRILSAHAEVIA